jgi:hypothetical protein
VQEWDQNYGNGVWTPSANPQQQPLMSQQPPPSRVQRSNNQPQARRQPNPRQQANNSGGQRQPRGAPAGQQQQWQPRQQQNEPRRQQQDRRQYQQQQQPEYQQQRTEERSERRPLNAIVNERNENFAVEAEHANSPEPSLSRFVAAFLFCFWPRQFTLIMSHSLQEIHEQNTMRSDLKIKFHKILFSSSCMIICIYAIKIKRFCAALALKRRGLDLRRSHQSRSRHDLGQGGVGTETDGLGQNMSILMHLVRPRISKTAMQSLPNLKIVYPRPTRVPLKGMCPSGNLMVVCSTHFVCNLLTKMYCSEPQFKTQRELLIHNMNYEKSECMVCYEVIRHKNPIWSCSHCYNIFHIWCIQKWSEAAEGTSLFNF